MQEILDLYELNINDVKILTEKLISNASKRNYNLQNILASFKGEIEYSMFSNFTIKYQHNSFKIILNRNILEEDKNKIILNQIGKILFYSNFYFKQNEEKIIIYDFGDNFEKANLFSKHFLSLI